MTLRYVRMAYGVPAKRGGKVKWRGGVGRITSATHYLFVKFPGRRQPRLFHPTDPELEYLDAQEVGDEQ